MHSGHQVKKKPFFFFLKNQPVIKTVAVMPIRDGTRRAAVAGGVPPGGRE
jgi:hypothetical protein